MRWILFDLVVGAALVWLVWDGRGDEPTVAATPDPVAVSPPDRPVEPVAAPVLPADQLAAPAAGEPSPTPPIRIPAVERGQRLRSLARDAEALFLRGPE